jgi:predicted amidohydrolase
VSEAPFRVAVGQWSPVLGRLEPNLDQLAASVEAALAQQADLLVTPELGLTGYLLRDLTAEVALPVGDGRLGPVRELSRRLPLAVGFVERGEDGQFYNAAGWWAGGNLVHLHRKIYLPTYGLFDEGRFFARGEGLSTFQTPFGTLALLVCEDVWHPSSALLAALQGATGLLVISAAPGRGIARGSSQLTSRRTWLDLLRLFGNLLGCWVAFSNRTGFEDGIFFNGGSLICSPVGEFPIVEGDTFRSGVWSAVIDPAVIARIRSRNGVLRQHDAETMRRQLATLLEGHLPDRMRNL